MSFITKYYEFINIYNSLLKKIKKQNQAFNITIYFLNDEFNIKVKNTNKGNVIFEHHFNVNLIEFNFLAFIIENEFRINFKKNLPNNINVINYDCNKNEIHILENNKLKLKIYYSKELLNTNYKKNENNINKIKRLG